MRILILGGTVFLGRHIVDEALRHGHTVTLFHRGRHGAELFAEVERLTGDRSVSLDALKGRSWDAVVDTCGYAPSVVRRSATFLRDAVGHYTFVSTLSVLAEPIAPGADESAPLATLEDASSEELTNESYGALKALCEQAAEEVLPGRVLNARPGLIVGPHDPSDRFTYWPRRVARGGQVLAPGRPEREVQLVDARDLAAWIVLSIESNTTGVYNAVGPAKRLTMGDMLEACRRASGSDATLAWVSEEFLLERDVGPWMELPLWLPDADNAMHTIDCAKARAAGLSLRPLEETARDTLSWDATRPADREQRAGMSAEREQELLEAWRREGAKGPRDRGAEGQRDE